MLEYCLEEMLELKNYVRDDEIYIMQLFNAKIEALTKAFKFN